MVPSKFQLDIFNDIKSSTENLVVEAVAGSGKSTTLEHGVGYLAPETRTAMFAFNRDIVEALVERMARAKNVPDNIYLKTINGFGWGICRENFPGVQLEKHKTDGILNGYFDLEDKKSSARYFKWKGPINRIIQLLKSTLIITSVDRAKIQDVADYYQLDLPDESDFFDLTSEAWDRSREMKSIMDFQDQIYQPVVSGWPVPQFEVAFVDELQDLNPCQQELMLAAAERFIGVGDSRQAIYSFAGADAKSLRNMVKRTNSTLLPLSVCYRCPRAVIRLAQKIVPQIQWCDHAPEGIVANKKMEEFRKEAKPGDFVLCRVTADLVSECLAMIREGRTAMVKGKEIGDQIIGLIDRLGVATYDSTSTLYNALTKYHSEQAERLERSHRVEMIEALNDRVDTLKVLLESEKDVAGVKRRINTIFSDTVKGVIFSTVHKAKGLESPRVWILRPDLMPHPNAKTPDAKEQEENLQYVAWTRTMFTKESDGELYFIEPKRR